MTTFDSVTSFILGFNYGKANGAILSGREIGRQFPDVEPTSFSEGVVDGAEGDRFRLELALRDQKKQKNF